MTGAPKLIAGPYKPPPCEVGAVVDCVIDGARRRIRVDGITDAPIPWPYSTARGGGRQLLITMALERALRTESVAAVMYHWGVSRSWVSRARRALEVDRMTAGTQQLWRELAPARLGDGPRKARKLTDARVGQLRRKAAAGWSAAVCARHYGISRAYASAIIAGKVRPDAE
jgi:hypothetical protein